MDRVDNLEKFMEDLYLLSKSDGYNLESVQKLQRRAVDDIIIEEIRSRILNDPGTPPSQVRISNRSNPGESNPEESAENANYDIGGVAENALSSKSVRIDTGNSECSSNKTGKSTSTTPLNCVSRFRINSSQNSQSLLQASNQPESISRKSFRNRFWLDLPHNSQSTLDSDDYSDVHVENDENPPLEFAIKRTRCTSPSGTLESRQGTSTSPQYNKSSNVHSPSSSSDFGFESH